MLVMVLFFSCDGKDQIDGIRNGLLYDGCENFGDFEGSVETKAGLPGYFDLKNVYFQSTSLCFPSTLIGLETNFDGLHLEKKNFYVDNVGSCERLPLLNLTPITFSSESSSSPFVEINPPLLDWGTNSLFTPSLLHLTVGNTHNSSVLHVFEPFSSDGQFYAYGFEKFSLAPGEVGSISFVFLPRRLGFMWAHVVLQTSFGGFVINAKGIANESPYGIEPFRGFELLSDGRLSWNLSLYNTFDDVLYVEEINARISMSLENASHSEQVICNIEASQNSLSNFGSFCKSGEREFPWMEVKSHKHWEVPPLDNEIIMIMDIWPPVQGNISGVICIKLQKLTRDKFETILVPLEAELDSKPTYNSLTGSVSMFFESLVPWDGRGLICTLSIRNSAPYLLRVVSIADNLKVFEVRYMEGLLLYPDTITQVALVSYNLPDVSEHMPARFPWMSPNCKLSLLTNDSVSPQIEIPCQDMVQIFPKNGLGSDFVEPESLFIRLKSREQKLINARTGSLGSIVEESLPLELMFLELLEADRLFLGNWRSQGTITKLSVLNEQELLFPVVQIGTQSSKWITVHNPSHKPVVMQLVLNSGVIIDNCKSPDDSFKPPFFTMTSMETQDGFSIPEPTTAEAVVHPFESAQIGPILFRPSKQCTWRSTALIRNNLSGVEWLPLQAFGGSHSLLLLEGSELVKKIEFNLDLPTISNSSSPDSSFQLETSRKLCVHQLNKELYAKNVGELPLEVIKLEVSGTNCGSDGFMIQPCKGFSLAPGETERLLISYETKFSASLVQRNLKLAMDTGFLVIPMEARLSLDSMNLCNNSPFWTVMWKFSALIFTGVAIFCLLFFVLHQNTSGSKRFSVKNENTIAISRDDKSSRIHRDTKNSRSIKKNENFEEGVVIDTYPCSGHSIHEKSRIKEKKDSDHQKKSMLQSSPPTKIHVGGFDSSEILESPQSGNLTVKVAKERGRRRKRRAGGGGLTSKFEVSSSQSGNSTPSSPLSPNAFTPNSSLSSYGAVSEEQNREKKQEFSFPVEPRAQEPQRNIGRPILLPSASFPVTGCRTPGVTSNFLASSSPIAPYARAPGSKLNKEKGMKIQEDEANGKKYTYDIWGNHFCGHLMGKPKELSWKVLDASEGDSQSFFTRDPQSLMMMSSVLSASGHKLTPPDVDYLYEIN